jgi:hypothetical protein
MEAIPKVFPKIADTVKAFVLIQRYSDLRLVDFVTLRTDALADDGMMIASQEKNEEPVFVPFLSHVLALPITLSTASKNFFPGTSQSLAGTKQPQRTDNILVPRSVHNSPSWTRSRPTSSTSLSSTRWSPGSPDRYFAGAMIQFSNNIPEFSYIAMRNGAVPGGPS